MLVYPGDPCSFDGQLKPVPSVGACKPGKWACADQGAGVRTALCLGAVSPAPNDVCTPTNQVPADEDCDGTIDNDCACSGDVTCGLGACIGGVQRCINNKLGACSKVAGPAKCDSLSADGNCNGMPDKDEDICKCQGQAVGSTRLCPSNPKNPQCNNVSQTCVVSKDGSQAQWDKPCPSGVIDCRAGRDNNCNGQPDVEEEPCLPCFGLLSKPSPATEVFPDYDSKFGPIRVLGCGAVNGSRLNAPSQCRSDSQVGLKCQLCPMEAWLRMDPATQPKGGDYWVAETPASAKDVPCALRGQATGDACTNGRVCSPNGTCRSRGCDVANETRTYLGLGCGVNVIPPAAAAGSLCCCE